MGARVWYIVCGLMGGGSINHGATLCKLVVFPLLCVRRLADAFAAITRKRVCDSAIRHRVVVCHFVDYIFRPNRT